VVYRKGEMTKAAVDRGWPHQVALPSSQMVAEFNTIMALCEGLSLCPRGHWFRRDGRDYVVKCFAVREDADKFAARFDGEYMTPETRPSWIEKPSAK
jgi:hypothetical protein